MRCYSPNRDSYGVLAANKNELAARAFERVFGVVVLGAGAVSWLSARLRQAASGAGAAAGVVSWESAQVLVSADCARCGGKLAHSCSSQSHVNRSWDSS